MAPSNLRSTRPRHIAAASVDEGTTRKGKHKATPKSKVIGIRRTRQHTELEDDLASITGEGDNDTDDDDDDEEALPETLLLPVSQLSAEVLRRICKDLGASPTGTKDDCVRRVQAKLTAPGRTPYEARKREKLLNSVPVVIQSTSTHTTRERRLTSSTIHLPSNEESSESVVVKRPTKRSRTSNDATINAPLPPPPPPTNGHPSSPTLNLSLPHFNTMGPCTVYITSEDVDRLFHTSPSPPLHQVDDGLITLFLASQVQTCFQHRPLQPPPTNPPLVTSSYQSALNQVQCWSVSHDELDFLNEDSSKSLRQTVIQLRQPFLTTTSVASTSLKSNQPPSSQSQGPWWHVMILQKSNSASSLRISLREVDRQGVFVNSKEQGESWCIEKVDVANDQAVEALDRVMGDLF